MDEERNVEIKEIPDGEKGIGVTVQHIAKISESGAMDFSNISLARRITWDSPERNLEAAADRVFWWVKQNVKYVADPVVTELVQAPHVTIDERAGDCDDQVVLASALMLAIGIPVRYVTIAAHEEKEFSHIYLQAEIAPGKWKSYDPATKGSFPGWTPPRYTKIGYWSVDDAAGNEMLAGWFSKTWKKIREELKRFERRIRAERDRATLRVNEEFSRWERNMGQFGKILAFGAKVGVGGILTVATGGALAGILSTLTAGGTMVVGGVAGGALATAGMATANPISLFVAVESFESPWKLSKEEWQMLISLASLITSAVLSIVTVGGAAPLLAQSVLQIANAGLSLSSLQDQIEERKKYIDALRAAEIQIDFELRIQREALNKLLADIEALEWYMTRAKEIEFELISYQEELRLAEEEEGRKQENMFRSTVTHLVKQETERYRVAPEDSYAHWAYSDPDGVYAQQFVEPNRDFSSQYYTGNRPVNVNFTNVGAGRIYN